MTAETHPQRAQIIEMLMDTSRRVTDREVAASLQPSLHYSTISRFRRKILGHAAGSIHRRTAEVSTLKDLCQIGVEGKAGETAVESAKQRLRAELQNSVAARKSRRERWISEAEKRPIVSSETGEIVGNMMDHKALAAHDRNEGSDIEFSAKLSGLMQDSAPGGATIRAVVLMPSPGDTSSTLDPGRLAVEIDLKR